jgi:hypothetical protein
MGHLLVIGIRRLPVPLEEHDTHDEKEHAFADIGEEGEGADG